MNGSMYLMMELHVNNVGLKATTTSAGIRFFYTEKLRPIEAAILEIGHSTDEWLSAVSCANLPLSQLYHSTTW